MSLKRRKPNMFSQKEFGKTDMTLADWEEPLVLHVKTAAASPCPMAGGVVSDSCLTSARTVLSRFFSPFLVLYPVFETRDTRGVLEAVSPLDTCVRSSERSEGRRQQDKSW